MSFDAKVFKILIASPGDVENERQMIPEVIAKWNNAHAEHEKCILLPVKWETSAAPSMGDRPQALINEQLVQSCDMVIGVFWTRLGSPTGASSSGTAEEIEWFISNKKPAMIYFSSQPLPQSTDLKQFEALQSFKKKLQATGLVGSYQNIDDLREQLRDQISHHIRNLIAPISPRASVPPTQSLGEAAKDFIKKDEVYIEDYEKNGEIRSFLVKGDSRAISEDLKSLGGSWNKHLKGWVFPMKKKIDVAEFLKTTSKKHG